MLASAGLHGQGPGRTRWMFCGSVRSAYPWRVSRPSAQNRKELRVIARRVMTERGLLPDFSAAVQAEADAITKPAADSSPSIRDLSGLLWASIDNDDSRDLDQLTVAAPMAGGAGEMVGAAAAEGRGGARAGPAATHTGPRRPGDEEPAPPARGTEPRDDSDPSRLQRRRPGRSVA